ncbi:MAG: hypothetical protein QME45_10835 [Clostridiales bacterium]|nr:hypothetical protein [Clostridiales bacterium]HBM79898.1 hypothetical protein [Clostridiaceae bacterium]
MGVQAESVADLGLRLSAKKDLTVLIKMTEAYLSKKNYVHFAQRIDMLLIILLKIGGYHHEKF